jgi:very-short-patch-repair endonuclease
MEYHNLNYLKDLRIKLRKNQTDAESILWEKIRNRKLAGKRFRRQHSFSNFIFDFYCASDQLVIELDGSIHLLPAQKRNDAERDEIIRHFGFTILRFSNDRIYHDLHNVLIEISGSFTSPQPPPSKGGGAE